MRKFRTTVAALVAVGTLSLGGAACTPEQAAGAGQAFDTLVRSMLAAWLLSFIPPNPAPTGVPPTTAPAEPVAP